MTDLQLFHQLSLLPESLKQEVKTFMDYLSHKEKLQRKPKKRQFGCAKGKIRILPGFDEPLEEYALESPHAPRPVGTKCR